MYGSPIWGSVVEVAKAVDTWRSNCQSRRLDIKERDGNFILIHQVGEEVNPVVKSYKILKRKFSLWSPWKYRCGQRTVRMAVVACSRSKHSLRAQAQLMRTETVETFELWEEKTKLLDIRERKENARGARAGVTF
ncbi:hypothetical protein TNCV_4323501 [Trichonephila clavipes]|nr:hypothetical protein TNCV_4323501 [Trichonephila clavipes]